MEKIRAKTVLLLCDAHQVKNMNICKGKVISMEKSILEN